MTEKNKDRVEKFGAVKYFFSGVGNLLSRSVRAYAREARIEGPEFNPIWNLPLLATMALTPSFAISGFATDSPTCLVLAGVSTLPVINEGVKALIYKSDDIKQCIGYFFDDLYGSKIEKSDFKELIPYRSKDGFQMLKVVKAACKEGGNYDTLKYMNDNGFELFWGNRNEFDSEKKYITITEDKKSAVEFLKSVIKETKAKDNTATIISKLASNKIR